MSEIAIILQVKKFWYDYYNVDTNWYAFWFPFGLWLSCWLYATVSKKDYGRWGSLHTLHHVGAITLGSLSLYYNDDSIFNERNGILWSLSYFIIDIIDTLKSGHVLYAAHGVMALILGLLNFNLPILRTLRMNSKASYIETSSLLMVPVKKYRKPWLFGIFAVVFTLCRMVWVPFMAKDLIDEGLEYTHPVLILLMLFYLLQIWWWIKIVRIAIKGDNKKSEDENKKKE